MEVSLTVSPIKEPRGNIIGASTIAQDITPRRQREDEHLALIQALSAALAQGSTDSLRSDRPSRKLLVARFGLLNAYMIPGAAKHQHLGLANIPILIAEDDPLDVFLLRRAFVRAETKASLYFVSNGPEVLDFLQGNAPFDDRSKFPFPELLLMDLKMPLLDGLEVLEWLQGRAERQRLRIVVLSGSAEPAAVKRAYALGVDSCLQKPQADDLVDFARNLSSHWIGQLAPA